MLLIDRMTRCDAQRVTAQAVVREDGLFYMAGRGLPGYVGFEMMAQVVSAFDGWRRRALGEAPAIGFLLGCRKYRVAVEWFAAGDVLEIEAVSLIEEGEMRSFDCRITGSGGNVLASGVLSVYRPSDAEAFFARTRARGGDGER